MLIPKMKKELLATNMILKELTKDKELQLQLVLYSKSPCNSIELAAAQSIVMTNEPHLSIWKKYLERDGANDWEKLQASIPQFRIPIREGISKTAAYIDVVKKGQPFTKVNFNGEFSLEHPDLFKCSIYSHPAGSLPVLYTQVRQDFENLYRLLGFRCEPIIIPTSVNGLMVSGFINRERIIKYKTIWLKKNKDQLAGLDWSIEMRRIEQEEPWQFKDRFILVMKAPYSGISTAELALEFSEKIWHEKSLQLRIEHELTHYAIKRLFGVMRVHLWDEIIADFMGISHALKEYRASWLLRFLGLDEKGNVLPNARILHYVKNVSPDFFSLLCQLVVRVSHGLETTYHHHYTQQDRLQFLLEFAQLSLLDMAE